MRSYTFLGHSSATIAIMLDTLYALYGDAFKSTIVHNISSEDNPTYAFPYQLLDISLEEINVQQWNCNHCENNFLLGSLIAETKINIYRYFFKNFQLTPENYTNLIHPSAVIPRAFTLSHGVYIGSHVSIAPFTNLENFVTVNRNATIGHHVTIDEFSTINPGVNIAGYCKIGREVTIGIGANIINDITIGDNSIVGAGSVVTKSIPPNSLAFGVPAKIIKSL